MYVDLDQDGDFTDETAMIDFKVNRDVGHFGTDNPATAVMESVPFVVVTDRSVYNPTSDAGSVVNLGIAGAQHGTHVAGITSANGLFGGAMSGAAPGAQLMAVKVCLTTTSCTSSGLIDGVLYAAHNGADVVNISIGGLPALNDGNNARARALQPHDRRVQHADLHLGRQQRRRGEHRRRPVGGDQLDQRRRVHHQGDLAVELRLRPAERQGPAPVLLARPA